MRVRAGTAAKIVIGVGAAIVVTRKLARMASSNRRPQAPPETDIRRIQVTYGRYAPWYDRLVSLISLGQERALRREAIRFLQPAVGAKVLDLACGTGANFPYLQEAVGPEGRIIGVDCTKQMLEQARRRVQRAGWQNVTLLQDDVTRLELGQAVDAALCTLAFGFIPASQRREVLRRLAAALHPGGRILVVDALLVHHPPLAMLANTLIRALCRPWIPSSIREAYWEARPWEDLRDLVEQIEYREFLGCHDILSCRHEGSIDPAFGVRRFS